MPPTRQGELDPCLILVISFLIQQLRQDSTFSIASGEVKWAIGQIKRGRNSAICFAVLAALKLPFNW